MPRPEALVPARMRRVAIVASRPRLRDALVEVAGAGTVELSGALGPAAGDEVEALRRLERTAGGLEGRRGRACAGMLWPSPSSSAGEPEELLAGEVALRQRADRAIDPWRLRAARRLDPAARAERDCVPACPPLAPASSS